MGDGAGGNSGRGESGGGGGGHAANDAGYAYAATVRRLLAAGPHPSPRCRNIRHDAGHSASSSSRVAGLMCAIMPFCTHYVLCAMTPAITPAHARCARGWRRDVCGGGGPPSPTSVCTPVCTPAQVPQPGPRTPPCAALVRRGTPPCATVTYPVPANRAGRSAQCKPAHVAPHAHVPMRTSPPNSSSTGARALALGPA
jgi:hypothetical protein